MILLDTNVWIKFLAGSPELDEKSLEAIVQGDNEVYVSYASLWEIKIKESLGKLSTADDIVQISEDLGINMLPISLEAITRIASLPHHHRDPFDRMLIAQCAEHNLTLFTSDRALSQYGENCAINYISK